MHLLSLILTFLVGIQARNSPYAKMAIQGSLRFQEIVIRHEISELFWLIHLDVFALSNKTVIIYEQWHCHFLLLNNLIWTWNENCHKDWLVNRISSEDIRNSTFASMKDIKGTLKSTLKWLTNRRWAMHGLLVTKLNTWRKIFEDGQIRWVHCPC